MINFSNRMDAVIGVGKGRGICYAGPKSAGGSNINASSFQKRTLGDIVQQLGDATVLMRCDFNGVVENGRIVDLTRLKAALPSIKFVLDSGAKQVVLLSHNGRPKELKKKSKSESEITFALTLGPLKQVLAEHLPVGTSVDFIDPKSVKSNSIDGNIELFSRAKVVLLENTRFDERDQSKKPGELKAYAEEIIDFVKPDIYVLDGFSVAHREQGSVTWPAEVMKERGKPAVAGDLLVKEYTFLIDKLVNNPKQPFVVFMGGVKVSGSEGKLIFIEKLLHKVDKLVIGGAMLYAFLLELGKDPGKDPLAGKKGREDELAQDRATVRELLFHPEASKLIIPRTLIGAGNSKIDLKKDDYVPVDFVMRDIEVDQVLKDLGSNYKTVFFNGPFGVFEEGFTEGSFAIYRYMSGLAQKGAVTVIGGGQTGEALELYEKEEAKANITWRTTGGGASMELLRHGTLPGFEALSDK